MFVICYRMSPNIRTERPSVCFFAQGFTALPNARVALCTAMIFFSASSDSLKLVRECGLHGGKERQHRGGGKRLPDQAADWISPLNAARKASSRSASVKPQWSSRAKTRSRKTPRFSTGTRSAAAQTVRSCMSCRRDGCQPLSPCALLLADRAH
jgi:hypothetical protein